MTKWWTIVLGLAVAAVAAVVAVGGCGADAEIADASLDAGRMDGALSLDGGTAFDAGTAMPGSDGGSDDGSAPDAETAPDASSALDAGGDDACPTTPLARLTTGTIFYHITMQPATRVNGVDLTRFEEIWGRASPSSGGPVTDVIPWPGSSGTTPIFARMPTTSYIAARFHVPEDMDTTASGMFFNNENFQSQVTLAISPRCGDFEPTAMNCVRTNTTGVNLGRWKLRDAAVVAACVLEPGADYYLNLRFTPLSGVTNCTAAGCLISVIPYH